MIKPGDRVKVIRGFYRDQIGEVLDVSGEILSGRSYRVGLDGENTGIYFDDNDLELIKSDKDGCECGSSVVGSPRHSYYCPLFKKED